MPISQDTAAVPQQVTAAPASRLPIVLAWLAVLLLRGLALVLLLAPLVIAAAWLLRGRFN